MRRISRACWLLGFVLLSAPPAHAFERWLYYSQNLWVDSNVDGLVALLRRASAAGYTHILLADAKFARLGEMDERYFRNVRRIRQVAAEEKIEIIPAVFPVGYSNGLLSQDPNLIEALPVREVPMVVDGGFARVQADPKARLRGGDFSDLKLWDWKDRRVTNDEGTLRMTDPNGGNLRISQTVQVQPYRQYHLSVRVKTRDFHGTPEAKVLAGGHALNYNELGVKPTQDWTVHHVVFHSLTNTSVKVYLGSWGGTTGTVWWDDATLEEVALVNLVRRAGAPLVLKTEAGRVLEEGREFEPVTDPKLGMRLWKGTYDIWHEPPRIKTALPDGTRLRLSCHHAVTVQDDQAVLCPSEPRTLELLRDQAQRVHAAWSSRGYMMSHDEIRVWNWCEACQRRGLDAGALLADNARTCVRILREVNPGGRIYVWSDMFDPGHNAHQDYYLARGNFAGSWEGLDREVILLPWYYEKRAESLQFFARRGHHQIIAGYYDGAPEKIRDWLDAARTVSGVDGVMYTTWEDDYRNLERFAELTREAGPLPASRPR